MSKHDETGAFATALGLPADAGEAEILTAVARQQKQAAADALALTTALGLPAGAGDVEILAAIAKMRERAAASELLQRVPLLSLPRIRELFGLAADAMPLDCAAALAGRVPADMAMTAIVAMQLAVACDEIRRLEVKEILRDALRV